MVNLQTSIQLNNKPIKLIKMNNTESKEPLYRQLNKERTQGEWTANEKELSSPKYDIGEFLGILTDKGEDEANAQYTALAVNNLSSLAEALKDLHHACMMDSDIPVAWWKKHKETVAAAKEALLKIS